MEDAEAVRPTDTALLPFLNSVGEKATQNALSDLLVRNIQPVIEKNLRLKLRVSLKQNDFSPANQEALEIAGDVKLRLIAELGRLKPDFPQKTIQNLSGYVASVTINAYRQYLRKKYPLRQQLKHKLRYLLTHHPRFGLWEAERGRVCGF